MIIFVDTSALITMLDADGVHHHEAARVWRELMEGNEELVCTNYVVVETCAVAQRRLGVDAIRGLEAWAIPLLRVEWIGEQEHHAGMQAVLAANRRQLSLVDCTSFDAMRRLGIRQVFAFDEHFSEQGFDCLP